MGAIGMSGGINRFGVSGPVNTTAPSGANSVTNSPDVKWWEAGPTWVIVFLLVGYVLVFKTLR